MNTVLTAIQLLGGLAMFLYGIELMGDGLKNSSGAALKRVLEKVTGNVLMGVITGALVTAVIQTAPLCRADTASPTASGGNSAICSCSTAYRSS